MKNFLICSTWAYLELARSSSTWISSITRSSVASSAIVAGRPCSAAQGRISSSSRVIKRGREGAAVAMHDRLGDPARLLEVVLDVGRSQVLAAGGDDDVLLAAGDPQEAVLVERAEVPGAEPAVGVLGLRGRLGIAPVLAEDVGPPHQHLAVVGDPDLDARQGAADRPDLLIVERVDGAHPAGLGQSVALQHGNPAGQEEAEDLRRDRGGAADRLAHLAAEDRPNLGEERLVGLAIGGLKFRRDLLARRLELTHLQAHLHRSLDLTRLGLGGDQRVELLEDSRDRGEVGGPRLGQLGDHGLGVAAEVDDRGPDLEGADLDRLGEDVSQGKEEVGDLVVADEAQLLDHRTERRAVQMREDAALRRAGGPRGVDEDAGIIESGGLCPPGQLGRLHGSSALAQLLEGDFALGETDHLPELSQPVADLLDFRDLRRVLADRHDGAGIAGDPLALIRRVGRVDRHDDPSRRPDREAGVGPLGRGVGEDADPVSGLDAEIDQAKGDLAYDRIHLFVADIVPVAFRDLVADRRRAAEASGCASGDVGDRVLERRQLGTGGAPPHAGFHRSSSAGSRRWWMARSPGLSQARG